MAVDVPDSFVARNKTPPRYPPPKPPSTGTVANQVPSATTHNHQKPHDKSDHRSQKHGQQMHIKSNDHQNNKGDRLIDHQISKGSPSSGATLNHKVGRFELDDHDNGLQPNLDHQKSQQNTGTSIRDEMNESDLSDDKKPLSISDNDRSISISSTNGSTDRYDSIDSYDIDTVEQNNRKNDCYDNPTYYIDHRCEKTIVTISDNNRVKDNLIKVNDVDEVCYVNKTKLTINTDNYISQYPIVTVNNCVGDRDFDLSPSSGKLSSTDTEDYCENYNISQDNIVPSDNDFRLSYNNISKSGEGVVLPITSVVNKKIPANDGLVIDDFETSDDNVASFNSYEPLNDTDHLSNGCYDLLNSRYKFAGCDIASSIYDHCKYMDDENELLVDSFDGGSYNVDDSINYPEVNASMNNDFKVCDDKSVKQHEKAPEKVEHIEAKVITNEKSKNAAHVINTYKHPNKLTITGYDNKAYISDMCFVESNSGHREMAVDVPDDFVQRKKTAPKYPVLKKDKAKPKKASKLKKTFKRGKCKEKEAALDKKLSSKSLNETFDNHGIEVLSLDFSYGSNKLSEKNLLSISPSKKMNTDEMKTLLVSKVDEESVELDVLKQKEFDKNVNLISQKNDNSMDKLWLPKSDDLKHSEANDEAKVTLEISKGSIAFTKKSGYLSKENELENNLKQNIFTEFNRIDNKQTSVEDNAKNTLPMPTMAFRCKDPKWRTQQQVHL